MDMIRFAFLKENILGIIAFSVMIAMVIIELFIPKGAPEAVESLPTISGEYRIEFPYTKGEIEFGEGWLDQHSDESYRWSRKESFFYAVLSDQQTIRMTGYLPEGIGVSHAELYLNDKQIAGCDLTQGQQFVLEGSVTEDIKRDKRNEFVVKFDGERVPTDSTGDQRTFSAMFSLIELQ